MIGLVIFVSVLSTLLFIALLAATVQAIDDDEVHAGWLILVMLLAFTTGASLVAASYEYSAAKTAVEDAAVIRVLPKHAEKP